MKLTLFAVLFASALVAQTPKADNCTPPPAAIAPSLPAKLLPGMGSVHIPITTSSPEAQQFFDQGLAQMHSFWAREAERSFLQAAALDPKAPMPQWGIAMVAAGDWRPRFQIDLLTVVNGKQLPPSMVRARAAAAKAMELAKAPGAATPLEKLYVESIAARRAAESKDPEEDFVKGLRTVLVKYPSDIEAQLDLSLMVMRGFTTPDKKPIAPGTMEAIQILRRLLVKVPDHPGVHHYVIHGWEGSTFAKEAWVSCARYSELVNNIPHAVHMPGHIYSQTGRWDDAVKSFSDAAVNERSWMKLDKQYGDGHHGHNVNYLSTSYSFEGRYEDAVEAARELLGYEENPGQKASADLMTSAYAQGWFSMLRAQIQFEKWDAILDGKALPELARPRQQAWLHWARAIALAHKNDLKAADAEALAFEQSLAAFKDKAKRPEPAELQVARQEMQAHLQIAKGNIGQGLKQFEAASKADRRLTYTEPPYYPRPVAEAWGHAAHAAGKKSTADKAYRTALEQYPGDAHAKPQANRVDLRSAR